MKSWISQLWKQNSWQLFWLFVFLKKHLRVLIKLVRKFFKFWMFLKCSLIILRSFWFKVVTQEFYFLNFCRYLIFFNSAHLSFSFTQLSYQVSEGIKIIKQARFLVYIHQQTLLTEKECFSIEKIINRIWKNLKSFLILSFSHFWKVLLCPKKVLLKYITKLLLLFGCRGKVKRRILANSFSQLGI